MLIRFDMLILIFFDNLIWNDPEYYQFCRYTLELSR